MQRHPRVWRYSCECFRAMHTCARGKGEGLPLRPLTKKKTAFPGKFPLFDKRTPSPRNPLLNVRSTQQASKLDLHGGVVACGNSQTRAHYGLRRPWHGRRVATWLAPADRRHRKPGDQLSQLLASPLARVDPGLPSRFLKAYLMLRASSPDASTLHSFGLIHACYPCMQICSVAAVDARWNRWQKHAEKTIGSTGVGRACTESRNSNGTALFDALVNVIRIRMYVWRV